MPRERAVAFIPARLGSTRFPGKVLANKTGRPLIQHVYEAVSGAASLSRVVVASDDDRVVQAAQAFGAEAVLTGAHHPNGTSRIGEAAATLGLDARQLVVNVQGDEPELDPGAIDAAVDALLRLEDDADARVGTIASPMEPGEDAGNPNIVKVVRDRRGCALYFSRSRIPFDRDGRGGEQARCLRHVGIYVYRRAFLDTYLALPSTPLEQAEQLEQLRILEHGYRIAVGEHATGHTGIDTPEQYEAFVHRWLAKPTTRRPG
jgi:3-deoxy-manno-octulosonate cytidylyltransferase (CMP-KDO synthetase)